MSKIISGFSKLSKIEKIDWLTQHFFENKVTAKEELLNWWHPDVQQQKTLDGFTENAITNHPLPFSVAPNFLINGKIYAVPMVIEESSVVAAASAAAKFWLDRGGFHAEVIDTVKLGQVHFRWKGKKALLKKAFPYLKKILIEESEHLTANMRKRGGGIKDIELLDFTKKEPFYYQLRASFETCDSMGANFINTVLENFAQTLKTFIHKNDFFTSPDDNSVEVVMSILSNYTPDCVVRAWVETPIETFETAAKKIGMDAHELADRFRTAVRIAEIDPYRATTHNKGIFNGIDAVVLATGNDFRAIEACGHAYAARDGQYRSLSSCTIENDILRFELKIPLAIGTIGGLTALHPLAKLSLELLEKPNARELMMIIACTGLAQNFAAVRSLVTTGIQAGHMKMHLTNILNHLQATETEAEKAVVHFTTQAITFSGVRDFLVGIRTV
jgi:hydroxymethylglutaryl-CoA reductase